MPIKLVVLDLDETMWKGRVYYMEPPFEKLDADTISNMYGRTVRIYPKTRELLVKLQELGIATGIASFNFRDRAEEVMRLFGILEFFPEPLRKIWLEKGRMKYLMIQEIIEEVKKKDPTLDYSQVLYYDDEKSYFEKVLETVSPKIHCLQAGVDLKMPYEILSYLERTK